MRLSLPARLLAVGLLASSAAVASSGLVPSAGTAATSECRPAYDANFHIAEGKRALKAVVLHVDFSDRPAPYATTAGREHLTGAFDLVEQISYGKVDWSVTITDWVRMPQPSSAYEHPTQPMNYQYEQYFQDAVRAADATVDFAGTDVVALVASYAGPQVGGAHGGFDGGVADGQRLRSLVTVFHPQAPDAGSGSVLAHELLHRFQADDLYTYGAHGGGAADPSPYVGPWSIMGLGGWQTTPDLLGHEKYRPGWLADADVACVIEAGTKELVLSSISASSGLRLAMLPYKGPNGAAYKVLEFRNSTGPDAKNTCANDGVLAYSFDPAVASGQGSVRVIDTRPGTTGSKPAPCDHELADATSASGTIDLGNGMRAEVVKVTSDRATVRVTRTDAAPLETMPSPRNVVATVSDVDGDGKADDATITWDEPTGLRGTKVVYDVRHSGGDASCHGGHQTIAQDTTQRKVTRTNLFDVDNEHFCVVAKDASGSATPSAPVVVRTTSKGAPSPSASPSPTSSPSDRPVAHDPKAHCDSQQGSGGRFSDVSSGNPHAYNINCIVGHRITEGYSDGTYRPAGTLSRAQTATFLARTLDLVGALGGGSGKNHFLDDDGNVHEHAINRLADAGIIDVPADRAYRPNDAVTRSTMAKWVAGATRLGGKASGSTKDWYADDAGDANEKAINEISSLGIVTGQSDGSYGPGLTLSRAQMGTFLARLQSILRG